MDEAQPKNPVWTCLEAACVIAASLLYLLSLSGMASHGQSDPAGNALEAAFEVAVEFLLWVPLTAFVAMSWRHARRSEMLVVGILLCLLGMIASIWALDLMRHQDWVRITPTALPLIALAYGAWLRFGARWPARWRNAALAAFALLAVAAAAPVSVAQQRWDAAAPQREAERRRQEAQYAQAEAAVAARYEAEFRALGPDSRLEQVLPFQHGEQGDEAMAKIRALRSRQADAVRLLDDDATELFEFRRMPEFGLAATAELCRSYRRRIARKLAVTGPEANDAAVELATYIENFRWLQANGCDMSDLAAQTAAALRRHPNDSARADAAMFDPIR